MFLPRSRKLLLRHWRSKGFRIFTYLDNGAGAKLEFNEACAVARSVRRDIALSGFVANEEKSQWTPSRSAELLGFIMDLREGLFRVPARRIEALKHLINIIIEKNYHVSARTLARVSGSLVSTSLAMGPVVRLWTRAIYRDIIQAPCWDKPVYLSSHSHSEILF